MAAGAVDRELSIYWWLGSRQGCGQGAAGLAGQAAGGGRDAQGGWGRSGASQRVKSMVSRRENHTLEHAAGSRGSRGSGVVSCRPDPT